MYTGVHFLCCSALLDLPTIALSAEERHAPSRRGSAAWSWRLRAPNRPPCIDRAIHVAQEVCAPVAHRQVVLTIPKRLRLHARFDRRLLGKLSACAWTCLKAEAVRLLGREDVVPGMVAAIQTHGELLHWHPHLHMLLTYGAFTPEGDFLELPQFDMERLLVAWQDAVFAVYLAEEKIEPEVVENMRTWEHSGFSVDQSVFLPAGDQAGIERLVQYMTRCPFSLARLVTVNDTGQVIYKAEKDACRAFPDPQADGLESGAQRNFQILPPLDFLAPPPPQTGHATHSGEGLASDSPPFIIKAAAGTPTSREACARRRKLKHPPSHPARVRTALLRWQRRAVAKHGRC